MTTDWYFKPSMEQLWRQVHNTWSFYIILLQCLQNKYFHLQGNPAPPPPVEQLHWVMVARCHMGWHLTGVGAVHCWMQAEPTGPEVLL